jgi:predicted P-loop ATPase
MPAPQPPPPDDVDAPPPQLDLLDGGHAGTVVLPGLSKSLASACRILRREDLRRRLLGDGPLEFNEMSEQVELDRAPLNDRDILRFREKSEIIVRGTGEGGRQRLVQFSSEVVRDALATVAAEHAYHPIREYLTRAMESERTNPGSIDAVADLVGVAKGLPRTLIRKWAIGCVARAFEPGCLHKSVLILVGPQNAGKSAFFRTLAGDHWFADTDMDLRRTDAYQQLHSAWIYEWSELSTMKSGTSMERIKAFVSSPCDTYRSSYGHAVERHPRTTVIVGSSNPSEILDDPTGNVRFWPLHVSNAIDLEDLAIERDGFWAEAARAYHAGEHWWLERAEDVAELEREHADFDAGADDAWLEPVEAWLKKWTQPVTVRAALEQAVKLRLQDIDKRAENHMAKALRRLGYKPVARFREKGQIVRAWTTGGTAVTR